MIYVKKTCPKCKHIIQDWKQDTNNSILHIGVPFEKCPNCNAILINKKAKEVNMLTPFDYIIIFSRDIISITLFGVLCIAILALLNLPENFSIFLFILILSIFIYTYIKNFQTDIKKSKDRLKNEEYAKMIKEYFKK